MSQFPQGKPFEFRNKKKNRYAQKSYKYFRRRTLQRVRDKKRLRRIVKLRRIHLERYISVKYKGGKWWNKLMELYFGQLTIEDIKSCKINTTSEIMLRFPEIVEKSKSFVDMFIFHNYPELSDQNTLKFLFHGIYDIRSKESSEQQDQDIYQLLVYKYKRFPQVQDKDQCYIADPDSLSLKPSQKLATIKFKNILKEHDIRAEYRVNASLKYYTSITDSRVLYDCLQYQQLLKRHGYSHIECQLSLLPKKMEQIHNQNLILWDRAISNYEAQKVRLQWLQMHSQEVGDLQIKLACRDRLLYFKKGFADKTQDELQEALHQLQLQQKRLIFSRRIKKLNRLASYNDCKICFYPEVKENNSIIFCIGCMASYHKYCYGLLKLENQQIYICDACQQMQMRDLEYLSEQRPNCEICYSRKDFPLKKVDQHFYHLSCLFFFNFANSLSFPIELKDKAMKKIKKFNKQNSGARCIYCLPENEKAGFCLKCQVDNCDRYFHPICGYLRGSIFQIIRGEELQVSVKCHLHSYLGVLDDQIRQVYLRRFFCNLNNIQKINEQQFKPLYQDQKTKIQIELRKLKNDYTLWTDYDKLRKRQCKRQIKNAVQSQLDYDKMSIQQLLKISKGVVPENISSVVREAEIYQQEENAEQEYQIGI